ncbi:hypothetical protein N8725_01155 [Alphaproteobacteria bacterium]|nr:hypothetical protein [Alphaproteobacteria bacterium]MDC1085868.1 hypothetical protein [Alphaproteobacteria bacterium]
MRLEEAKHIEFLLNEYTGKKTKPEVLLNLGSSTGDFRKVQQPHIERYVFQPLKRSIYKTIHFDIKSDEGVDISGNIFDPETQNTLKKIKPSIIMCCNLLEHLEESLRNEIQNILDMLLEKNGILLITVPYSYPLHFDPIDTYFRPSPQELSKLFPNYRIIDESIIMSSRFIDEFLAYSLLFKIRTLVRLFTPFYKFKEWKAQVHRLLWLFRNYKISCVMLIKN